MVEDEEQGSVHDLLLHGTHGPQVPGLLFLQANRTFGHFHDKLTINTLPWSASDTRMVSVSSQLALL